MPPTCHALPRNGAYIYDTQVSAGSHSTPSAGLYDNRVPVGSYGVQPPSAPYGYHRSAGPSRTTGEQRVDWINGISPGSSASTAEPASHFQSATPVTPIGHIKAPRTNRKGMKARSVKLVKHTKTKLPTPDNIPDNPPTTKVDTPLTTPRMGRTPTARAAPAKKRGGKRDPARDPVNEVVCELVDDHNYTWQQVADNLKTNPVWNKHATVAMVYGRFMRNAEEWARLNGRKGFRLHAYIHDKYRGKDGQLMSRRTGLPVGEKDRVGQLVVEDEDGRVEELLAADDEDDFLMQQWEKAEVEMYQVVAREMT